MFFNTCNLCLSKIFLIKTSNCFYCQLQFDKVLKNDVFVCYHNRVVHFDRTIMKKNVAQMTLITFIIKRKKNVGVKKQKLSI